MSQRAGRPLTAFRWRREHAQMRHLVLAPLYPPVRYWGVEIIVERLCSALASMDEVVAPALHPQAATAGWSNDRLRTFSRLCQAASRARNSPPPTLAGRRRRTSQPVFKPDHPLLSQDSWSSAANDASCTCFVGRRTNVCRTIPGAHRGFIALCHVPARTAQPDSHPSHSTER